MARQLAFDLAFRPAQGRDDFLTSPSNQAAFQAVLAWSDWPDGRLAISGPAGCGKSHLVSIWGQSTGGVSLSASELTDQRVRGLMLERAVAIEDVHGLASLPGPVRRQCETALFHLYNFAAAEGTSLLITGREAPARWSVETPDLASRLAAMAHIAIQPPDDVLLTQTLRKLFTDRQLTVTEDVIQYMLVRMERSFAAAEHLVDTLDHRALEQRRRITRPLAAGLFSDDMDDERPKKDE